MREVEFLSDYTKFKKGDKYTFTSDVANKLVVTHEVAKYTDTIEVEESKEPKVKAKK